MDCVTIICKDKIAVLASGVDLELVIVTIDVRRRNLDPVIDFAQIGIVL